MYQDNWVKYPGGIKNEPRPIAGTVVREWTETERGNLDYHHVEMSTGEHYKRHFVYFHESPYGWERVVD